MPIRKASPDPEASDLTELDNGEAIRPSAGLAEPARRKTRQLAAREAFHAYEAEHGALTNAQKQAGERFWRA